MKRQIKGIVSLAVAVCMSAVGVMSVRADSVLDLTQEMSVTVSASADAAARLAQADAEQSGTICYDLYRIADVTDDSGFAFETLDAYEALDADNLLDYKSLSQVFETLRKSARFTEAQNAEDKSGLVSSVGQLVQLCEREGGIIAQFPDPEDYPSDKVDLTINDYKQYAIGLLRNEPNIAGLIESYVAKLEKMEAERSGMDADVMRVDVPTLPQYDDDGLEVVDDTEGGRYAWTPDHSRRIELDEDGFVTDDEMDRLLGDGWRERLLDGAE